MSAQVVSLNPSASRFCDIVSHSIQSSSFWLNWLQQVPRISRSPLPQHLDYICTSQYPDFTWVLGLLPQSFMFSEHIFYLLSCLPCQYYAFQTMFYFQLWHRIPLGLKNDHVAFLCIIECTGVTLVPPLPDAQHCASLSFYPVCHDQNHFQILNNTPESLRHCHHLLLQMILYHTLQTIDGPQYFRRVLQACKQKS